MGLSIEDPAVRAIRVRHLPLGILIRVDHVRVLEHFGKEEGLLEIIEAAAVSSVDVVDGTIAAADTGCFDDRLESCEGPLPSRC